MTDAPERIWLDWRPGLAVLSGPLASKPRTEYIRADTNAALEEAARIADDKIDCFQKYVDANEARIDAEAKLAQAVEVLSLYHDMMCDGFCFDLHLNSKYAVAMAKECVGCKARAFLATIQAEGETDDKQKP
jgi:hypothetical protein